MAETKGSYGHQNPTGLILITLESHIGNIIVNVLV